MSIIGTFLVKVKDGGSPHKALNMGEFGSAGLMLVASYFIINTMHLILLQLLDIEIMKLGIMQMDYKYQIHYLWQKPQEVKFNLI